MHLAVLCAVRSGADADHHLDGELEALREQRLPMPDRVGWIAPVGEAARRAEVLHNRHGARPSASLHFDEATSRVGRSPSVPAPDA